jgi:hypothetical protein
MAPRSAQSRTSEVVGVASTHPASPWSRRALTVAAPLALGGMLICALRVRAISASVDPELGWPMVAACLVCVGLAGWQFVRSRRRWVVATSFAAGVACAAIAQSHVGECVHEVYLSERCLQRNRSACFLVFLRGVRPEHDVQALVPACEFGFLSPCYLLLRREPEVACRLQKLNCGRQDLEGGLGKAACSFVERNCAEFADTPQSGP